jgi:hypothetical protein
MQPNNLWNYGQETIECVDYPIGGKLISAKIHVHMDMFTHMKGDESARQLMREKITVALALGMLDKQLVEINSYFDHGTDSNVVVARAYVAPNGDVKILRTYK